MKYSRILTLTVVGLVLAFQVAYADKMEEHQGRPGVCIRVTSDQKASSRTSIEVMSSQLVMLNIGSEDRHRYFQLFQDSTAMAQYMQGGVRDVGEIHKRYEKYLAWWTSGNPFTSYLVFLNEKQAQAFLRGKENTPEVQVLRRELVQHKRLFVGHVLLEPGEDRGLTTDAEVSYVLRPQFWGNGFGKEAVANSIDLARLFNRQGIRLNGNLITSLIATARADNGRSCGVLEGNGFIVEKKAEKFGVVRRLYTFSL